MDRTYYDEIARILHGLLVRLDDRLPGKDVILIAEFIGAVELVLAHEQMADVLSEDGQPLRQDERDNMLALAERMQNRRSGRSRPDLLSLGVMPLRRHRHTALPSKARPDVG